ncbi:MAG TPA: VanW family protein [Gaiellaceae bacterium]|nr:VanW family protein [Gaiellaceae bacterium]
MRAEAGVRPVRRPRAAPSRRRGFRAVQPRRRILAGAGAVVLALVLIVGVAFSGSDARIAAGVEVAGVKVSGLTAEQAEKKLSERAASLAEVPVTFTGGGRSWRISPMDLELSVDWPATLAEARAAGDWPLPFRGLKRVTVRLFGAEVAPRADVYEAGLKFELGRIAASVDRKSKSASIVLNGVTPRLEPARDGTKIDLQAAEEAVVSALAGFSRKPVALPIHVDKAPVGTEELRPVLDDVRTAVSRRVRLGWHGTRWMVSRERLAKLLSLPRGGSKELTIGGPYATLYFKRLSRAFADPPKNAQFEVQSNRSVRVVRAQKGRVLDAPATASALLEAALSSGKRSAELVIKEAEPSFTTKEAKELGITRELVRYSTFYTGTADRITNLKLATTLLDGTRIAPGATFSFNREVGPRTEARGFRSAPVIIGSKYEEGVGGGVSQVATTVFNAAWEAGLKIKERTAHALYISRYPLGRDATVNYPEIDLKFVNDTKRWLVMRAVPTETGIAISLLGAPTGRRVVSVAGELQEIGPAKIKRVPDPGLFVGEKVIEEFGSPPRAVTVTRTVYVGNRVLYEETWRTAYQSEPRVIRFGTIPVPEAEPEAPPPDETTPTETTPTTPTTTAPTGTTPTSTTPRR